MTALPDDQAARDLAATELSESAFIEAGAGTGKSTTLVHRIVSTVERDPGVEITRIAAITFTERAGGDLRHRLREGLAKAAEPGNARVSAALDSLDAATVGTIHSLAQQILRTHALSAGLPLGFTVATGAQSKDDRRLRARAVVEHWQGHLDAQTIGTLAAYGVVPADLVSLVSKLDGASLRLDDLAFGPQTLVETSTLCTPLAERAEQVLLEVRSACLNTRDRLYTAIEAGLPDLIALLRRADEAELAAAFSAGTHPAFQLGSFGSGPAWTVRQPKEWRDYVKELQPDLARCLLVPLENAVRVALAQAWTVFVDARDAGARDGVVDFDGLLSRTRDLLATDAAVRAAVHDEYRVVLVDEFQDTDPVQWDIVRLITADPHDPTHRPLPGRLIVVGDPKQAIYSFRGANIDTFTMTRAHFAGTSPPLGQIRQLTTNFRSVGPLLDWVNQVFAAGMADAPFQVDYTALKVRNRPQHPKPGPAVTVLRDPEPEPEPEPEPAAPHSTPKPFASTLIEPRLIAQEIARAVREGWQITGPLDDAPREYERAALFSDIAILYPARTGVPALLEALDEAGVPYRSGDAGLVFQRPGVLGLLAAMAVIDDPSRQLDLWLALKSPLFACGDDDLLRHRRAGGRWSITGTHEPTGRVAEAMATLGDIASANDAPQPVTIIDALLDTTRLLEVLAYAPRGSFEADCLRMLRAHAQQWQDGGGVGLADYLVAQQDAQSDATRAALPEPDDRDDNAVRLMTVFQAKGLEFPIVALAGMSHGIYDPAPEIGVVSAHRFEFAINAALRSTGYAIWDTTDRIPRADAERMRLAYVACTRARDHLIVSACGEGGTVNRPHASLLWKAIPRSDADVVALEARPPATLAAGATRPPELPSGWVDTVARLQRRCALPSVALPSGQASAALGLTSTAPPVAPGATAEAGLGPSTPSHPDPIEQSSMQRARTARDGRPLGRAVHAALDALVSAGAPPDEATLGQACERAAAEEGIQGQANDVRVHVSAVVDTPLFHQALHAPRRWSELYLAAPVDPGAVEGIELVEGLADLVFESPEGLVLVDYKTDETIDDATMGHYRAQLGSYAELLRRATGRVVAQTWIVHAGPQAATSIPLDIGSG